MCDSLSRNLPKLPEKREISVCLVWLTLGGALWT